MVCILLLGTMTACSQKSDSRKGTTNENTGRKPTPPTAPKKLGPFERHKVLKGHELAITAIAFRPDGKEVATGSYDKTVRIWDVETGKLKQTITGPEEWVSGLVYRFKGERVAASSGDKTIRIWRAKNKWKIRKIVEHNGLHGLAQSPDEKLFATAGFRKGLRIWNANLGDWKHTLKGHTSDVRCVAFSPDGKTVVSGSVDQTVRLWRTATGKEIRVLEGHKDWVTWVGFTPDGKQVLSASRDKTVRLWDAATGQPLRTVLSARYPIRAAALRTDGRVIAVAAGNQVTTWDVATGKMRRLLPWSTRQVTAVAFSPDGTVLAFGGQDNRVQLWRRKPVP